MTELSGVRVLVAEDDFIISMHIESILTNEGASVRAVNSLKALAAAEPSEFDVIILDNHLVGGAITTEADRLREAGVGFVSYSGMNDLPCADDDVIALSKPSADPEIIGAVKRALDARS